MLSQSVEEPCFELNTRDRDRGGVRTIMVTKLDPDLLFHSHPHRAVVQVSKLKPLNKKPVDTDVISAWR